MRDCTILVLTVGRVNYDCDINFYDPLSRLFSQVIRYNYLERHDALGRVAMNDEVLDIARAKKPRYVFFITYQDQILLETLQSLRENGCRVIAWFSDDHWRFEDYSRYIASYIFCSLTTDKNAFKRYKLLRLPVVLTQWAANPRYYQKLPLQKNLDLSFVGQKYAARTQILEFLLAKGFPLQLFGRGFGAFLEFEDIIRIFNQSRININLSGSSKDPGIKQIKGRTFEVPLCGGFLLSEYSPNLEEYFKIGSEIITFSDEYEASEKIRYFLSHEDERAQIADAGYRRAMRDHCWERRMQTMFDEIEKEYGENTELFQLAVEPSPNAAGRSNRDETVESLCKPGDLVFDIGANVGIKAEAFVKQGMRVVCFEPQPACVEALRKRFCNAPRVTVVEKGIAANPGILELSICTASPTISTFSEDWKTGRFAQYEWDRKMAVEVITLDTAIKCFGMPQYCKIDVEGFELDVLNGLNRPAGHLSFEFTREFIDAAMHCVDRCVTIGYKKFNVVIGEGSSFFFPEWTGPAVLFKNLFTITDNLLWGDIYARQ